MFKQSKHPLANYSLSRAPITSKTIFTEQSKIPIVVTEKEKLKKEEEALQKQREKVLKLIQEKLSSKKSK